MQTGSNLETALQPWSAYIDLAKVSGELMELTWSPHDEQLRAELYRQLLMNVTLGYFLYFQADPDYPDWSPFRNSVFLLQPNPDDTIHYAPVRGGDTYRIVGSRGSVRLLTFTIGADMLGMTDAPSKQLAEYDAATLPCGDDGSFAILLSAERPQNFKGNWWHLDPGAEYVLVRKRCYDWGNERDARLAIERIGDLPLKPRMDVKEVDRRVRGVFAFADRMTRFWLHHLNAMRKRNVVNRVEFVSFKGGVASQQYWQGIFEIAAGEALILETALPRRRPYWNVQLNDPLWNTIEYVFRQSSLNGYQARLDADGKFRAVISKEDPGVANWLDTGGYRQGTFVGRWYACDSTPLPSITKVRLADVRSCLPADTPSITAQERQEALRLRRIGAQLRRRW